MSGKFTIKQSSDKQFYFNLLAANGEIILSSEMYKQKASAENGIASVQANAADDSRYDRREGSNGQPHFVLKAANHEIIGTSQTYSSKQAMEGGIDSVKNNAPSASIEDLS